jgi:hypothetical protein
MATTAIQRHAVIVRRLEEAIRALEAAERELFEMRIRPEDEDAYRRTTELLNRGMWAEYNTALNAEKTEPF